MSSSVTVPEPPTCPDCGEKTRPDNWARWVWVCAGCEKLVYGGVGGFEEDRLP